MVALVGLGLFSCLSTSLEPWLSPLQDILGVGSSSACAVRLGLGLGLGLALGFRLGHVALPCSGPVAGPAESGGETLSGGYG